jgi:hypothetical protein
MQIADSLRYSVDPQSYVPPIRREPLLHLEIDSFESQALSGANIIQRTAFKLIPADHAFTIDYKNKFLHKS